MRRRTRETYRFLPFLLLAAMVALAVPTAASAQYFGRNKVHYEDFHFRILETQHYKIYYYPAEKEAAEDVARMAERWYNRLSDAFQHAFQEKKPIVLYANHPDFEQTNTGGGGFIDQGTGGFTEPLKDRLVMPVQWSYWETNHVVGHEMTHEFQFDQAQAATGPGEAALNRVPTWMTEGMAEWQSLGRQDALTSMWMRDGVLHDSLPTIKKLNNTGKFFPYRFGEALWAYIAGEYGDRAVPAVYTYATQQGVDAALRRVLGVTADTLSAHWIAATKAAEEPVIKGRTNPDSVGKRIITEKKNGLGGQNLAPVLSDDGKYVAYLSAGLFSFNLYLADAETGRVIRQLVNSATATHFDQLSFMNSAGSFSPDGKMFATVVFKDGNNRIALMDVKNGDIKAELNPPVGAIAEPSWSPDGKWIAFSGNKGGITNLYLINVKTHEVRQLTHGRTTELQPAWSPDGTKLAYTTDAKTNFETLSFGKMQIAVMDVATGETHVLPLFAGTKNINPQWSPDGQSVYFLANPDGVQDVFRYSFQDGRIYRVTHVATAVSGLTRVSPALSVARKTGSLVFTVFNRQGFDVDVLSAAQAQGEPMTPEVVAMATDTAAGGVIPPLKAEGHGMVHGYLHDALTGLPLAANFKEKPYTSGLSLDMIAPPQVGVGTSPFGTGVEGGVAGYFSDMLGDKQLGVAVQANGTVKDIGGTVEYYDLGQRWNYGVVAGHIPYLLMGQYAYPDSTGQYYEVDNLLYRIFIDEASGIAQYPFSETRRLEFQLGFTRYSYNIEIDRYLVDPFSGQILQHAKSGAPACSSVSSSTAALSGVGFNAGCTPPALNLVQASVAYVGDNSVNGFTSPIQGGRFRFEFAPTFGSLQFETVLADYRHYFYHYPFTLAVRAMHYGRYGTDADSLQPEFLGYQWFVRGYDYNSFSNTGCTQASCPINELWGSRIAVANVELRVPLLGVKQYGLINFPFLPTDLAAFFDTGLAWYGNNSADPVHLKWANNLNQRVPVASAGLSARMNILGYLVLEVYYAYPFQRPDEGWHWGFQIMPGW